MPEHKRIISWAFYDWANSAFAVVVLAGFFPIFFREYWAAGEGTRQITFYLGAGNSLASLAIVLLAPILGAIADQGGIRKKLLIAFSLFGMAMTAALFWIGPGDWSYAVALFVFANIGWMGANTFYDALLVDITHPDDYDRVSALGYGLGYLGGGLLFALCVAMTLAPQVFYLDNASQAVLLSFLLVALWWLVFSVPLWIHVCEPHRQHKLPLASLARRGFGQLIETFHHIRSLKPVVLFLLAYWLYIDGVDTVIRMAVDFGKARGLPTSSLISALLITQFVGFPAAIAFGYLARLTSARAGILAGLAVYILITVWASRMHAAWEFYTLATVVGLVQGGVQSLSRSCYAGLIPADKSAEFFGFYNMLGKFSAIIGPLLVGWVGLITGSETWGLLSLLILFVSGAALLIRTPTVDNQG